MNESKLYKVLSFVHLVFILSIVFFTTSTLTLSFLFIPSLSAAFAIGRDLLLNKFNIYDGLVKRFFKELGKYKKTLKHFPIQILFILELIGLLSVIKLELFWMKIILIIIMSLLMTFIMYLCGFIVFLDENISYEEVFIRMFYKIEILISLFVLNILLIVLFSIKLLFLFFIAGALVILAIEAGIYYTIYKEVEKKEGEE